MCGAPPCAQKTNTELRRGATHNPAPADIMRGSARGSVETETLAPLSTFFEKKVLRTPKNFCPDKAITHPQAGEPRRRQARKSTEESKLSSVLFQRFTDGFAVRPCGNVQFAFLGFCG